MRNFPENSLPTILLKWLKNQKKDKLAINEIREANIGFYPGQIAQAIFELLDDNQIDLTNDLKIIVKDN